ncbi:hypothetical protein BsWGS_03454 [Bradybaena similaris]
MMDLLLAVIMGSVIVVETSTNNGACIIGGKIYANGEIFTVIGNTTCQKYTCRDGQIIQYEEACSLQLFCYPPGVTIMDAQCRVYNCTAVQVNGQIMYRAVHIKSYCRRLGAPCEVSGYTIEPNRTMENGQMSVRCTCIRGSAGTTFNNCNFLS